MEMTHKLPRVPIVDRVDLLSKLAYGRTVVHCGFVGQEEGRWELHERLAPRAASLVGIDIDAEGVNEAQARGYKAYTADCRDPSQMQALGIAVDLVIAGELIEHLDAPGAFLDGMRHLGNRLVITTPNAFAFVNTVGAVLGREFVNPTHVTMFSYRTLSVLLDAHGWEAQSWWVYRYPKARTFAGKAVFGLQAALSRPFPFLGHGLVVEATARQH
jgi:hypothetical protein